ncbi:DUF6458 family protein [Vallicoccus soli]|uniref:DUF6458 domain-containing protein n=1 Tax=Vallicoccus soli TaxID=2339232 RepID=A0A3A3Z2C9_9ACTN|nr:DUF6458 family protein [Vallicoccus soli]RJK96839.1 hypothetical protein D5H78_06140 [Vallicoccus soli]
MRIGSSVLLLAVGAVLAFAVADRVDGVDLQAVGWIVMGAGALGLLLTLLTTGRASRTRIEERTVRTPDGDVRQRDIRSR